MDESRLKRSVAKFVCLDLEKAIRRETNRTPKPRPRGDARNPSRMSSLYVSVCSLLPSRVSSISQHVAVCSLFRITICRFQRRYRALAAAEEPLSVFKDGDQKKSVFNFHGKEWRIN